MMKDVSYGAARTVAPVVHEHLAQHLRDATTAGESPLASLPEEDVIAEAIATAFWASLRREEGHPPRISLAFVETHEVEHPLTFQQPLEFQPGTLTKLAAKYYSSDLTTKK